MLQRKTRTMDKNYSDTILRLVHKAMRYGGDFVKVEALGNFESLSFSFRIYKFYESDSIFYLDKEVELPLPLPLRNCEQLIDGQALSDIEFAISCSIKQNPSLLICKESIYYDYDDDYDDK